MKSHSNHLVNLDVYVSMCRGRIEKAPCDTVWLLFEGRLRGRSFC